MTFNILYDIHDKIINKYSGGTQNKSKKLTHNLVLLKKQVEKKQVEKNDILDVKSLGEIWETNGLKVLLDHRLIIVWAIPILYFLIMIFLTVFLFTDEAFNEFNKHKVLIEMISGFIAFIIMFFIYFIFNLNTQTFLCKTKTNTVLIKNSVYNSFIISIHIFIGYSAAVFLNDSVETQYNKITVQNDNNDTILNNIGHKNNIYVSILFYYIAIYYNNTLNKCNGYSLC